MRIEEKHEKAARALARGWTRIKAAESAGVSERTLGSWLHDPDFLTCISEQQGEVGIARANSLTPLVIQFVGHVSHAGKCLDASVRDEQEGPVLRSNLNTLVSALAKLIELEKNDAASQLQSKIRIEGLTRPGPEGPAPVPAWQARPALPLGEAAAVPPKAVRDAEGAE